MSERETKVDANTTDDVEKGENDLLNEESKSRAKGRVYLSRDYVFF